MPCRTSTSDASEINRHHEGPWHGSPTSILPTTPGRVAAGGHFRSPDPAGFLEDPDQASRRSRADRTHREPLRLVGFRQDEVPSLEGGVEWINSGPITLAQLKGKIVLLDFWTYCCINCHHVLPTLAKLEEKYKNELVIIGVHSGKFDAERNSENIRRKVARVPDQAPGRQRRQHDDLGTIRRSELADDRSDRARRPPLQVWQRRTPVRGPRPRDREAATSFKGQLNLEPIALEPEMNKIAARRPALSGQGPGRRDRATGCSSPTRATTGSSRRHSRASHPW